MQIKNYPYEWHCFTFCTTCFYGSHYIRPSWFGVLAALHAGMRGGGNIDITPLSQAVQLGIHTINSIYMQVPKAKFMCQLVCWPPNISCTSFLKVSCKSTNFLVRFTYALSHSAPTFYRDFLCRRDPINHLLSYIPCLKLRALKFKELTGFLHFSKASFLDSWIVAQFLDTAFAQIYSSSDHWNNIRILFLMLWISHRAMKQFNAILDPFKPHRRIFGSQKVPSLHIGFFKWLFCDIKCNNTSTLSLSISNR